MSSGSGPFPIRHPQQSTREGGRSPSSKSTACLNTRRSVDLTPYSSFRGQAALAQPVTDQVVGPRTLEKIPDPPVRTYECENYNTCLGMAAALDWESFSCLGCCQSVNEQLLWRAHHTCKLDDDLADLCDLPPLKK